MTRTVLLKLHRGLGLALAGFLFVLGLTGSLIVFEAELDALLNPDLFHIEQAGGAPLPPAELIRQVEAGDPRIEAYHLSWSDAPTQAAVVYVRPRANPATGESYRVPYDEVFIDPVSGEITGRRLWGECCLERRNLMPFLYKLHNRLLLPMSVGRPLLGVVALGWLVLILVGGYLTLPTAGPFFRQWRRAWAFGRGRTAFHTGLKLHRGAGLWLWPLLACLAITGAALGLEDRIRPVVDAVSPLSSTAWERYAERSPDEPVTPRASFTEALAAARAGARRAGARGEPLYITYSGRRGLYRVGFGEQGAAGIGPTAVYVDGLDGRVVEVARPGDGTAGDIALRASQPVHTGHAAGLPGRIAVFVAGLAVALMSATGVVMWLLRQRRRVKADDLLKGEGIR